MATAPHTLQTIANEVVRLLFVEGVEGDANGASGPQHTVEAHLTDQDLSKPLDEVSVNSLRPIAAMLKRHLGGRKVRGGLQVPKGANGALAKHDGIEVRVVQYHDSTSGTSHARFDILASNV